jgi:hypothetical protein
MGVTHLITDGRCPVRMHLQEAKIEVLGAGMGCSDTPHSSPSAIASYHLMSHLPQKPKSDECGGTYL